MVLHLTQYCFSSTTFTIVAVYVVPCKDRSVIPEGNVTVVRNLHIYMYISPCSFHFRAESATSQRTQ